ncbi:MAG: SIS domain-containing protein [Chloroflexi bacterium]|nr:SIS domain-containing protein [Chloroflexota bacterium]
MPPIEPVAAMDYHATIVNALACRRSTLDVALSQLSTQAMVLTEVAILLVEALRTGHKVLAVGNGGAAAQAQHFAAELVGRFKRERAPYAVLSLTTDTSILTAIANDYSYQDVFERQVLALGRSGDLLLAFSTSGESENIIRAAKAAQRSLMAVIVLTSDRPNRLECLANVTVRVPVVDTALTQELHMVVIHILCDLVESELAACEGDTGK